MESKIIIQPKKITALAKDGEKFVFKPEAEKQLLELLQLKEMIDNTVDEVKVAIAEAGQSINPNFKGVIGDKVRCTFRAYGSKYGYDWKKKSILEPFLDEKTRYYVNSEAVDKYIEEVGELPDGITENPREEKLSISMKDE